MRINIYEVLFWIFFIISIIVVLWYLFGNSPTLEEALLILAIGFLFKIHSIVIENKTEIRVLKNSFVRLAEDFKIHIKR